MINFLTFKTFFIEYVEFFENMVNEEKNKLETLVSNDIKKIEQSILNQQVNAKKVENIERKRMEMLRKHGIDNYTFKEIIELFADEEKSELQHLYNRMEIAINNVKFYNTKSMEFVKMNLRLFEGKQNVTEGYQNIRR